MLWSNRISCTKLNCTGKINLFQNGNQKSINPILEMHRRNAPKFISLPPREMKLLLLYFTQSSKTKEKVCHKDKPRNGTPDAFFSPQDSHDSQDMKGLQ